MKIIFCLPGASFSGRFLQCWTELLGELPKVGISYGLSQKYLCNIYHVRTKCLGASLDRGTNQKPFGGKVDYDYIMWIDSDIIFKPEQFFKLIDHDRDIISGLYMMQDNINYATVEFVSVTICIIAAPPPILEEGEVVPIPSCPDELIVCLITPPIPNCKESES